MSINVLRMVTGPGSRDWVYHINGENGPICIPADVVSLTDVTWTGHLTSTIATCMVEATQQQSVPLASLNNGNYKIIRKVINGKEQKLIYKVQLKLTHQTLFIYIIKSYNFICSLYRKKPFPKSDRCTPSSAKKTVWSHASSEYFI